MGGSSGMSYIISLLVTNPCFGDQDCHWAVFLVGDMAAKIDVQKVKYFLMIYIFGQMKVVCLL